MNIWRNKHTSKNKQWYAFYTSAYEGLEYKLASYCKYNK